MSLISMLAIACGWQLSLAVRSEENLTTTIEVETELSHSVVTDITQDQLGYIWIATEAGLNRYDGYDSLQYYKQSHQLSDDDTNVLERDSLGNVWIGTEQGLTVYWQDKNVFQSFTHNPADALSISSNKILSLSSAEDGDMWIGTNNGISFYQASTQSFKQIALTNAIDIPLVNDEISAVLNADSFTLLGTENGQLATLNDKGYFSQIEEDSIMDKVKQLVKKSDHEVYLLTESSLYLWDQAARSLEMIELDQWGVDNPFIKIKTIVVSESGSLWLGTDKSGLYKVDTENKQVEVYFYRRSKEGNLGTSSINTLFEDRTGIIWVGSNDGIHQVNPHLIQFKHYTKNSESELQLAGNSVFSMMVDADGWYWFGTEFDGISVFRPTNKGLEYSPNTRLPQQTFNSINAIIEGPNSKVWILAADGLWSYDKNLKEFTAPKENDLDGATLFNAKYYKNELWISTDYGIWRLDEDGNSTQYLADQQKYNLKNKVLAFEIDKSSDSIWLATEQGVLQFDIATESFKSLDKYIKGIPQGLNGVIYDLFVDIHDRLWVGTYQNGLYKIDFTKQTVEVLNSANSKLNNVIYAIQPDKSNYLWLATARGLYRLDTNDNGLTHFNSSQVQPVRDFNLGAKTMDLKGNMLLAGINGVVHFDPLAYEEDPVAARPIITDVMINGQRARIGNLDIDHSKLPPNITKQLTLFHSDTSLSFSFSGMHFASPKSNRFRYKLEGYDDEWIEVDSQARRAIYGKLESGDYEFKLKAANKDGIWSEQPKAIKIKVLPSPYFSNIALLIYALIFGTLFLIAGLLYRARINEKRVAQQQLSESEERLKLSLWGSGDELWDWDIKSGALHLSNEWDVDFPRDGIRSGHSDANSNIHPNDLPFVKQALQSHLNGKSEHFESTYRLSDEKGGWIWVLDQGKSVEFDGERASRMAGTIKNVSEIKDTEQQLSVIVKSFENISDGVWILDSDLRYIAVNKAFEAITGYSEEDVVGAPMQENAIKDMSENFYKRLMLLLNEKGSWQGELEAIRSDGTLYPIDINIDVVRDGDDNVINYVGVFSDITYRKIAEKELRRLATTDQLTGLPNRNTFRTETEAILAHSGVGKQHALLFIDLDNFKRINDSLGHSVGDELLVTVADQLLEVIKGNKGIVARLGGDEFIIFLEDVDAWNHPAKIAQAVLESFSEKLELTNNQLMVSPSIGIVMYPENGSSSDELLRNADTAMYYAKKKGKNTFQFYTRQMNEQAQLRLNLENELRTAIERDEFVVFYQPKVSLATGKIKGFEALVRWRSEKRGLVMPNEFIPLAEETGLIIPISQQVIEKACIQVRDWQKRDLFHGKMAINLSAIQFYHQNLWETVKNALHLANLEAEAIEFEITEGMVMQDLAHSIQQMNTLKEMGVALALDDFGVGYSSLGNLKDFPIDTLKIDRSFVWDLDDSERDKKLVASIITLAHNLDIKVVAEGVETIKQVEALSEMECEQIQGFIFSRPLPAFEIEKLLTDPDATLARALQEAREDEANG